MPVNLTSVAVMFAVENAPNRMVASEIGTISRFYFGDAFSGGKNGRQEISLLGLL